MSRNIYLIGSLRNPNIPIVADRIRLAGHFVFDNWHAAGPEADDYWQAYEKNRGYNFTQALASPEAHHVYSFDKRWLDASDTAVMLMPAGKSAHLELGYMIGQGRDGFILMDQEPERYDVMYNFAKGVFFNVEDLIDRLEEDFF